MRCLLIEAAKKSKEPSGKAKELRVAKRGRLGSLHTPKSEDPAAQQVL